MDDLYRNTSKSVINDIANIMKAAKDTKIIDESLVNNSQNYLAESGKKIQASEVRTEKLAVAVSVTEARELLESAGANNVRVASNHIVYDLGECQFKIKQLSGATSHRYVSGADLEEALGGIDRQKVLAPFEHMTDDQMKNDIQKPSKNTEKRDLAKKKEAEKSYNRQRKYDDVSEEALDEISHELRKKWLSATFKNHSRHLDDDGVVRDALKGNIPDARAKTYSKQQDIMNKEYSRQADEEDKAKLAARTPKVHDLRHLSHGEVYDKTQTSDRIHDGDLLHVKGGVGMLYKAWPVMLHGESKTLHNFKDGDTAHTIDGGRYHRSAKLADKLAGESMNEAATLRLLKTHSNEDGSRVAKVYKDTDWGEHRVEFYKNGTRQQKASYHTDDKDDAHETAKSWVNEKNEAKEMSGEDPCWKDYKMVGTKKKGGKEVPNCVPEAYEHEYDKDSVEKALNSAKVKPKARALTHALLKGRVAKNTEDTKKTFPNVKYITKDGHPDWKKHGVDESAASVTGALNARKYVADDEPPVKVSKHPMRRAVEMAKKNERDRNTEKKHNRMEEETTNIPYNAMKKAITSIQKKINKTED